MPFADQVQTIYQLLDDDRIQKLGLFRVKDGRITTPVCDDLLSLISYRTNRPDEFRSQHVIEGLIGKIKASKDYRGINHIGFCYKVVSKSAEAKRLIKIVNGANQSIYREPSNDAGDWLFVGDTSDLTNPLLEFIPHEGDQDDPWLDLWLPHIQFDVDTSLSPEEVKAIVRESIDDTFVPYPIQIDGIIYIQRVRLGCAEGINVFLDIATNNRNPNYRKTWRRLT